jgi:chromosome partitioning protein
VNELSGFLEAGRGKNVPWSKGRVFATKIRRNIKLAESPSFGLTILAYEPSSNGAADYRSLAKEVATMDDPAPKVEVTVHVTDASKLAIPNEAIS